MRATILVVALSTLCACTGPNTDIRAIQFNQGTETLPADYHVLVRDALENRQPADGRAYLVSQPMLTVGASSLEPQRWYLCVRGVKTNKKPSTRTPPLWTVAERAVFPETRPQGIYEVILLFDERKLRPSVRETFDSPLCRNADFGLLGV